VLLLLWFFVESRCTAQELEQNNLTIFSHLIQQTALQVLEQVKVDAECCAVILSPETMHAANWLIEKELIAALSQKGITECFIITIGENPDFDNINCSFTISYQPIAVSIDYKQSVDKILRQDDLIQRVAAIELYIRILDKNKELIYSDTIQKLHEDTIKKGRRTLVENVNYSFTRGEPSNTSIFSKFIEPAIGIGVAGAILYIFYSFRSK